MAPGLPVYNVEKTSATAPFTTITGSERQALAAAAWPPGSAVRPAAPSPRARHSRAREECAPRERDARTKGVRTMGYHLVLQRAVSITARARRTAHCVPL